MQRRASPTVIVVCALAMCTPSIMDMLRGALTVDTLCLRLSLAFVVSYVGVRTLTRLVAGYAATRYLAEADIARGPDEEDTRV